MAACCPAPITVNVQMPPQGPKRGSRSSSKASCRGNNGGIQVQPACGSGSQKSMPNYMKPLSRTPSYSARINIGGGGTCCPGHPRPDCCRVPCPPPECPRCPGIYAEKVQSMKPRSRYEASDAKFEGISTYREHYFMKCVEKVPSCKPVKTFDPSDAKMEGLSTYRETFHCKPLSPQPSFKQNAVFVPSDAKFEAITQYRTDYTGCMAPRQPSFKPFTTFVPSDAKLDGISTYKMTYIPYCPREYDYARPKQSAKPIDSPSCGLMDGVSTYRMDYYPKCAVKINSLKPATKPRFSDAKMEGITTYKTDFIPFHFNRCPPSQGISSLVYDELYPNPCLFGCSGDPDPPKVDDDCMAPCPPPPMCGNGSGDNGCGSKNFASGVCDKPFPWTAGNAGEQIRGCCDCLDDPPLVEKEDEEC